IRSWPFAPILAMTPAARTNGLFTRAPRSLFGGSGRRDLGNKASPALECYVAPQPGNGDNETILDANQKVDVHCAPKHPADKAFELNMAEFYDGGAPTDGRQSSLMPITKWRQ